MKPNELRIGNWIEIIQQKKGVYTTLQQSSFTVDLEAHFKPIKLTEEWLLNLGFIKDKKGFLYLSFIDSSQFLELWIDEEDDNEYFIGYITNDEFEENITNPIFLNHIKYVNQLQNIYFALTGEELKFKKQ